MGTGSARRVARSLGIANHRIAKIDLRIFGGSALTADIEVPKGRSSDDMTHGIPVTYVPARNTIFLSFALAWAEVLGAKDIFIGVNALDYSGYPDCRPEYIRAFEPWPTSRPRPAVEGRQRLTIHTPLITLTKAQIIRRGIELGVDYSLTSSCYDPRPRPALRPVRLLPAAAEGLPRERHERSAAVPRNGAIMSYAVKEIFYTLQGEGAQAGRAAVFCRFAGCNLWSGRESDRASAICRSATPTSSAPKAPAGEGSRPPRTRRCVAAKMARPDECCASLCALAVNRCCNSTSLSSRPCTRASSKLPSRPTAHASPAGIDWSV